MPKLVFENQELPGTGFPWAGTPWVLRSFPLPGTCARAGPRRPVPTGWSRARCESPDAGTWKGFVRELREMQQWLLEKTTTRNAWKNLQIFWRTLQVPVY